MPTGVQELVADTSTDGCVEIVRSDGGSEFRGRLTTVCIDDKIKPEYQRGG